MPTQTYRRAVELLEADINDELVALEPEFGACFGFNSVARDVWRMLEKPNSFDEIRGKLLKDYEVSADQCTNELRELLQHMSDVKLVEQVRA